MKLVLGLIIGLVLGMGGMALAQFWSGTDSQGHTVQGYTDPYGNSMYSDDQGHSGTLYQLPPAAALSPRNPC